MTLVNKYDYLGWIPNIKSDLSFATTNDTSKMNTFDNFSILGYADKIIGNLSFPTNFDNPDEVFSRIIVCTGFGDIHDIPDTNNDFAKFTRHFLFLEKNIQTNQLVGQFLVSHTHNEEPCKEEVQLLEYFKEISDMSATYKKKLNEFNDYEGLNDYIEKVSRKILASTKEIKNIFSSLAKINNEPNSWLNGTDNAHDFKHIHYLVDIHILKSGIVLLKLNDGSNNDSVKKSFHGNGIFYHQTPRHYKIILSLLKEIFHTHSFHSSKEDSLAGCTTIYRGSEEEIEQAERLLLHQFNFLYKDTLKEAFAQEKSANVVHIKNLIGRCHYKKSLIQSFVSDKLLSSSNETIIKLNHVIENTLKSLNSKKSLLPKFFPTLLKWVSTIMGILGIIAFIVQLLMPNIDIDNLLIRILVMTIFGSFVVNAVLKRHYNNKGTIWIWLKNARKLIFNFNYFIYSSKGEFMPIKATFNTSYKYSIQLVLINIFLKFRKNQTIGYIIAIIIGVIFFVTIIWCLICFHDDITQISNQWFHI